MQRCQKPPECALPGQTSHLQHPGQHGILGYKGNVVEAGKPDIDSQYHRQHELINGHGTGNALHRQRFLNQLLETQLLQHGRHGEQTAVGGEILALEVVMRPGRNFIGLWNSCVRALLGAGFVAMLVFVLHHLGDSWKSAHEGANFAAILFYDRISRVSKWFFPSVVSTQLTFCA